jgi:predicted esterase
VAGFVIDGFGAGGAYVAAAGFALAGTAISAVFVRGFPDLRDRDPSPMPDTAPTPVVT